MFLLLLLGIFAVFCFIKYQSLFKGYDKVDATFPGPKSWPLFGNILGVLDSSIRAYKKAMNLGDVYKGSFRFWVGPILVIALTTPEDSELVLGNPDLIQKGLFYHGLTPWIGRGLFTSFGDRWKKHRKLLAPVFNVRILEGYADIFKKNTEILLQLLEREIGNKSFDMMHYLDLCVLDNICETAMGVSIDAQTKQESEYPKAIEKMRTVFFFRMLMPIFNIEWLFSMTPLKWMQNKALNVLHGLSKKVIDERIEKRKELAEAKAVQGNNGEDDNDLGIKRKLVFLDHVLDLVNKGQLSIDDVFQEVNTFMLGGHDTVTSALSFASYFIANHPQYQEQAYLEQQEIFGDDQRAPTRQDLQQMKYLEMIIKETLRLHPSIPLYVRYAVTDVQLGNSAVIPKGSNIAVSSITIHRREDFWEKPNEFYPDHFLPEACAKRHPYAYMPFGAGPRICIGQKFAMMEMKSILSQILRRFKLIPASPQVELEVYFNMILTSNSGMKLAILPRKEN